jgi:hypothetical protein
MILGFNAGTFTKTNEMLTSTVYKYVLEHYLMSEESTRLRTPGVNIGQLSTDIPHGLYLKAKVSH